MDRNSVADHILFELFAKNHVLLAAMSARIDNIFISEDIRFILTEEYKYNPYDEEVDDFTIWSELSTVTAI